MPSIQGKFKGVNKLCKTCQNDCKQFENVKVIKCWFKPKVKS